MTLAWGEGTPVIDRLAAAFPTGKAAIHQNHGLFTVGQSVDEAVFWFLSMDRTCQAQLLAMAAGTPQPIPHEDATYTREQTASSIGGTFLEHDVTDPDQWRAVIDIGPGIPSYVAIITNAHALARQFVTLDNFYVDAEVSYDGHAFSTGAYAAMFLPS